jgi:hypothetical protein
MNEIPIEFAMGVLGMHLMLILIKVPKGLLKFYFLPS